MSSVIGDRFEVFATLTDSVLFAFDRKTAQVRERQSIVVLKCLADFWKDDLVWEEQVYKALGKVNGFPCVIWSGESDGMYWLAIDYVGCSLERLHFFAKEEFTPEIVAAVGVQMIDRLKYLHSLGFIHGDVMPSNITFGPITTVNSEFESGGVAHVNLIDFGAGRRRGQDRTAFCACHPTFASIRMSRGLPPEERDDLESLAYTLIYLAMNDLPWLKFNQGKSLKSEITVTTMKGQMTPEEICEGLPSVFAQFLRYTRELEKNDIPDYDRFMLAFAEAGRIPN